MRFTQSQVEELLKKAEPQKVDEYTFFDPGYSILQLREKFPDLFYDQSWYDDQEFAKLTEEPRERTIRIIPDSNNKTFEEQKAMLRKDEEVTKARQLAMLSVLLKRSGEKDIREMVDGWVRCEEKTTGGLRVGLDWRDGGLVVDSWDVNRLDRVWLSSVRTS